MSLAEDLAPQYTALPALGLELPFNETEALIYETVHRFARDVMRPAGRVLDRMSPEDVIAEGSPLWDVTRQYRELGLGIGIGDVGESEISDPAAPNRMQAIVAEELGWGDAGLAISLTVSGMPALPAMWGHAELVQELALGKIGCWAITEPDHGSDMLDVSRGGFSQDGNHRGPNCIVHIRGNEIVVNGQKSAWVSNGSIAEVALLFSAVDRGNGPDGGGVFLIPLDAKGVSRGKPLDKLGQRALNQGEIFFDNVTLPISCMVRPPEEYEQAVYDTLCTANAGMATMFTGTARAAYEVALDYAHDRRQGGAPIIRHQHVRYRLFHMFRQVEMSRALARRVSAYNAQADHRALEGAIAAKVTATQTAFDVASEAVQMLGGNGLTRAYETEKILRDARASMIEDGCNELLAIKGGTCLMNPDYL